MITKTGYIRINKSGEVTVSEFEFDTNVDGKCPTVEVLQYVKNVINKLLCEHMVAFHNVEISPIES